MSVARRRIAVENRYGPDSGIYLKRPPEAGQPARIAKDLRTLYVPLRERLEAEEAPGGLHDELRRLRPELAAAVTRLRRQHDAIITAAYQLDRYVRLSAPLAITHTHLVSLEHALAVHEADEIAMLQDALLTDIGGEG